MHIHSMQLSAKVWERESKKAIQISRKKVENCTSLCTLNGKSKCKTFPIKHESASATQTHSVKRID